MIVGFVCQEKAKTIATHGHSNGPWPGARHIFAGFSLVTLRLPGFWSTGMIILRCRMVTVRMVPY